MSPTVLRERGYRIVIYLNDHTPAHVHVFKAEKEARVALEPVDVLHNFGFNSRELAEIVALILVNQGALLSRWDRIHSER